MLPTEDSPFVQKQDWRDSSNPAGWRGEAPEGPTFGFAGKAPPGSNGAPQASLQPTPGAALPQPPLPLQQQQPVMPGCGNVLPFMGGGQLSGLPRPPQSGGSSAAPYGHAPNAPPLSEASGPGSKALGPRSNSQAGPQNMGARRGLGGPLDGIDAPPMLSGGGGLPNAHLRPMRGGGAIPFPAMPSGVRVPPNAGLSGYGPSVSSGYNPGNSMQMAGGYDIPGAEFGACVPSEFGMGHYGGMGQSDAAMGMSGSRWGPEMQMGGRRGMGGGGIGDGGMGGDGGGSMGGGPMSTPRMMGGGGNNGPPSRAIFINQLPEATTYEELCNAVGCYGNLESIRILEDKRQAFINFVDAGSALQLMMATGQQAVLRGKPVLLLWAKTRQLAKELSWAIRSGATRNLYVSNVPEIMSDAALTGLFKPFGELESVRMVPKKRAAFINFTSITSAMAAKDSMHGKAPPLPEGAPEGAEAPTKTLMMNFTSAQQNCMSARGQSGGSEWDNSAGYRSHGHFGRDSRDGGYRHPYRGRHGGHGGGQARGRGNALPARSRGLYFGSLPDSAGLTELAAIVEPLGIIESLRLVRPKSCGFVNFDTEAVARALQARFTASEEAAPVVNGKRLTVNFAKARPCTEEQLQAIADGARRKLLVRLGEGGSEAKLTDALGHRSEALVETSAEPADGADDDAPPSAVRMVFSSISVASTAKSILSALECVTDVEYIVEPVEPLPEPEEAPSEGAADSAAVDVAMTSLEIGEGDAADGVEKPAAESTEADAASGEADAVR